ncbi:hypothetical protein [Phenylobacterium sp.]|uniref:hypothetical protein n=1 Tax=Phenylobacterium sp. TaxID=1871053 RepID=UPI0035AFFAB9
MRPSLILAGLAAALAGSPALAEPLHGRISLADQAAFNSSDSLDAALGDRATNDALGDLRLTWEPRAGAWDFSVHYELGAEAGPGVATSRAEAAILGRAPPATLLDLTGAVADRDRLTIVHRIDRLAVGYSTPDWVVRVGRQALTWGAGTVFHPMDLVDPFAPDAVDVDYKAGVDMIYVQKLFADGSDLQFIAAPRPARPGGPVEADASTFALHYHGAAGAIGTTAMLARDHGDWTAAAGLSGPLGGAVWNLEIVPTWLDGRAARLSLLANVSDALALAGRNATVFAEYHRNGFGASGEPALDALPAGLAERIARGQAFTVSRDYLAAGISLEWTPLLTLAPTLIANLDDGSAYLVGQATWSLSDDAVLIAGAQAPMGPGGTEYGGLPLSAGSAVRVAPASRFYLQLRRYF